MITGELLRTAYRVDAEVSTRPDGLPRLFLPLDRPRKAPSPPTSLLTRSSPEWSGDP
ncbi:hypothetical protein [Rhizohabitans arisaemae]|uniref:hypothetical protein n=1 Tax=Rhizohabitans arisaemae TaxID=2720610 RepID=UPI0024B0EC77|nr:hypothetical protein [Rhizohabitans arisaemae]